MLDVRDATIRFGDTAAVDGGVADAGSAAGGMLKPSALMSWPTGRCPARAARHSTGPLSEQANATRAVRPRLRLPLRRHVSSPALGAFRST